MGEPFIRCGGGLANLLRVAASACDARRTLVRLRFSAKSAAARDGWRGPYYRVKKQKTKTKTKRPE